MPRILVVDDEPRIRELFRLFLEREGYQVEAAADGEEGLKLFREDPADLVVTDLIMPRKEGMETIIELRRDFPEAKIIAISGGGRATPESYLKTAQTLGAQRVLMKPFNRDELLEAVAEVLGGE
jgi:DNA-binding response OmpR family regulator